MNERTIVLFQGIVILVLFSIIFYQRFVFRRGIQTKLRQINKKLEEILETDSDEKIMIFTENPVLMDLGSQPSENKSRF